MENNEKKLSAPETEAQPETRESTPAPQAAAPKQPASGGNGKTEKLKRGGMATLLCVVFIAIVVAVNILVSLLSDRFPSLNVDLTAQGLNTLSEQAEEIARDVENDTAIYLIGREESYRKDSIYSSYQLKYSQVANLAERLREVNPKISVRFVDPDENPAFIAAYPEENLRSGDVLVATDKRYRALSVNDLFAISANSSAGSYDSYSKVDSALAGALEAVNLEKVPVLTLTTGHDELLSSSTLAAFTGLLEAQNFDVREINLLTDPIPEETSVLMLGTPSTDYTEEEIQKLRDFLDNDTVLEQLTLLVTCHVTQSELPRLAAFLEEWGVRVESGVVVENDSARMVAGYPNYVLVDADQTNFLSEGSYNNLIAAASAPLTLLFDSNLDIGAYSLWNTSDQAYVITEDMTDFPEDPETRSIPVATISFRYAQVGSYYARRSVLVFGSSMIFTGNFINATAYGDRQYILDLLKNLTNTDGSAVTVTAQSVQTNVLDVSASAGTIRFLGMGVFTIGLPVLILAAGLVIFLRRRHL